MPWPALTNLNINDAITDSWVDNVISALLYLKGGDGQVELTPIGGNGLKLRGAAQTGLSIYTDEVFSGQNRNFAILNRFAARGQLDFLISTAEGGDPTGGTRVVAMTIDSAGVVRVTDGTPNLLRVHRHPYANQRHVESGQQTYTLGAETRSVSFTDAFSSAPSAVMHGSQVNGDEGKINSVSTTGFSLINNSGGTQVIGWITEGPD